MLGPLAVKLNPLARLIEQIEDFVPLKLTDASKVAVRKGETPGGEAVLRSCGRCLIHQSHALSRERCAAQPIGTQLPHGCLDRKPLGEGKRIETLRETIAQ